MTDETEPKRKAITASCPVQSCREVLGKARDEDGYTREWWADKMIGEHLADFHD